MSGLKRLNELFTDAANRAAALEAERDRLREALDDLCDRQHDYPTDLSKNSAWYQAFDDARALLAGSVSDKDRA
jgi:hypothetical protein